MKEQAKQIIRESLNQALSQIDSNDQLPEETRTILKEGLSDQINTLLDNMDKEPETPILSDEAVPTLWNPISDVLNQVRIAYLDHNVISKVSNDPNLKDLKDKFLEMKKDGWIFIYSQTHIEETSLINPSVSLKDKSETPTIVNILSFIKEVCGNFLIDPVTKTIQTRSPIELFNTINDVISVNVGHRMTQNFGKLITEQTIKHFRDNFNCQPKDINNCKDFREATNYINRKITQYGSALTQSTGITNLHDWILFNIQFAKNQNQIQHNNDDYSYFTQKALMFEFFGYHAQKTFAFKSGLLADGNHGYISTLVNLFVCDDNKLVKSLRDSTGFGIANTEILTLPEFRAKYLP